MTKAVTGALLLSINNGRFGLVLWQQRHCCMGNALRNTCTHARADTVSYPTRTNHTHTHTWFHCNKSSTHGKVPNRLGRGDKWMSTAR